MCCAKNREEKETITYYKETTCGYRFKWWFYSWIFGITVNKYADVENVERRKQSKVKCELG